MSKRIKKGRKPQDIRFATPKDEGNYKAKRLYWALLSYEDKMSVDITSVNIKDYILLVNEFTTAVTQQKKKGKLEYRYANKIDKRMDTQGSDKGDSETGGSQGVSQDGSADLGVGVRTINPIT